MNCNSKLVPVAAKYGVVCAGEYYEVFMLTTDSQHITVDSAKSESAAHRKADELQRKADKAVSKAAK